MCLEGALCGLWDIFFNNGKKWIQRANTFYAMFIIPFRNSSLSFPRKILMRKHMHMARPPSTLIPKPEVEFCQINDHYESCFSRNFSSHPQLHEATLLAQIQVASLQWLEHYLGCSQYYSKLHSIYPQTCATYSGQLACLFQHRLLLFPTAN